MTGRPPYDAVTAAGARPNRPRGLSSCEACGGPLYRGTWRIVAEGGHQTAVHDRCWTLLFDAEMTAQRARENAQDAVRRSARVDAAERRMRRRR